jgi:hypothetical protein
VRTVQYHRSKVFDKPGIGSHGQFHRDLSGDLDIAWPHWLLSAKASASHTIGPGGAKARRSTVWNYRF